MSSRVMMPEMSTDAENLLEQQGQQSQQHGPSFLSKKLIAITASAVMLVVGAATYATSIPSATHKADLDLTGFVSLAAEPPTPVFTVEEGNELSKKFTEDFGEAMCSGDFSKMKGLMAAEFSWEFTADMPPAGKGSPDKFWDDIFGKVWPLFVSEFKPTNIYPVVDTMTGEAYISLESTILFDAHGKVKVTPTSLVTNPLLFAVTFNKEKKVTHMAVYWDPLDADLGAALALITPKKKDPPPMPTAIITTEEGEKFAKDFMEGTAECFEKGDFSDQHAMFADKVGWNFAGAKPGEGTRADYFKMLMGGWGAIVSKFHPTIRGVVVDSVAGNIYITFDCFLILDGRGATPLKDSMMFVQNMFKLTVDKDKKITYFLGRWDAGNKEMGKEVGAVMAAAKK